MRNQDQVTAQRAASRIRNRAAKTNPLFAYAGILEEVADLPTPDQMIERRTSARSEFAARMQRMDEQQLAHAEQYRQELITLLGGAEVEQLETNWLRSWAPKTPEYRADFWHTKLRKAKEAHQ